MDNRTDALVEIAKIVGTHGLRGDLKVRPNSDDPELLLTAEQLHLRLPTGQTRMVQTSRRALHKGQVLLRIQGCDSLTQVEPFVGGVLLLAEALLPDLADDEYYWRQLKGLSVVDRQRGVIGTLEQMFSTAAHDTYVVKGVLGEIMIPAVEQFVLEIDLQERVMKVDLPDGLLPDE
jgi:16S rRNA processing protein RimM